MSLRKKGGLKYVQDRSNIYTNYNESGPNNPSVKVDPHTNYIPRPITLENIDEAVYKTFNRRFNIQGKDLDLIMLDMDVAALRFQHPESFDKIKEFIQLPYFTCWRTSTGLLYRTSPSSKPIIYTIPTMKPQGVVYEEYRVVSPPVLKFPYVFKFMSTRRDNVNTFEKYMLDYFKNKRNLIQLDKERFEIAPANPKEPASFDTAKRDTQGRTLYTLTYNLEVLGYLRDIKDIQKREKPNTLNLKITERVGENEKDLVTITQIESRL